MQAKAVGKSCCIITGLMSGTQTDSVSFVCAQVPCGTSTRLMGRGLRRGSGTGRCTSCLSTSGPR